MLLLGCLVCWSWIFIACVSLFGRLVCRFAFSCSRVAAQLDSILLGAHTVLCRWLVVLCVGPGSLSLSAYSVACFVFVVCRCSVVWCIGSPLLVLASWLSPILFFSVLTASCVATWSSRVLVLDLCRFSPRSVACFLFVRSHGVSSGLIAYGVVLHDVSSLL